MGIMNKIKTVNNVKLIAIGIGGIAVIILGFKIIELIRDTGLVENKDKKIGQLVVIKKQLVHSNEDLRKQVKEIQKTEDRNIKTIIKVVKKNKQIDNNYTNIKKEIKKKIKYTKHVLKTRPKNINVKPNDEDIEVNKIEHKEIGKILINNIWDTYNITKETK